MAKLRNIVLGALLMGLIASAAQAAPKLSREFERRARYLASEEMTDEQEAALKVLMDSGYLAQLYTEWRELEGCEEAKPSADELPWKKVESRTLEIAEKAAHELFGSLGDGLEMGAALPARVGPDRRSSQRYWVVPIRSTDPGGKTTTRARVVVDVQEWTVDKILR